MKLQDTHKYPQTQPLLIILHDLYSCTPRPTLWSLQSAAAAANPICKVLLAITWATSMAVAADGQQRLCQRCCQPNAIHRYICEAQLAKILLKLWRRLRAVALPVLASNCLLLQFQHLKSLSACCSRRRTCEHSMFFHSVFSGAFSFVTQDTGPPLHHTS